MSRSSLDRERGRVVNKAPISLRTIRLPRGLSCRWVESSPGGYRRARGNIGKAEVTLGKAKIFCEAISLLKMESKDDDVFIYNMGFYWETRQDWSFMFKFHRYVLGIEKCASLGEDFNQLPCFDSVIKIVSDPDL